MSGTTQNVQLTVEQIENDVLEKGNSFFQKIYKKIPKSRKEKIHDEILVVPVCWLNEKRNGKSHLKLEKTCKNEHSFGREKGAESGVYMHFSSHAYI